jgi:hypothetical protein
MKEQTYSDVDSEYRNIGTVVPTGLGKGVSEVTCGNLPQSASSQVEDWLPSNQAVTQQWTGYLATLT